MRTQTKLRPKLTANPRQQTALAGRLVAAPVKVTKVAAVRNGAITGCAKAPPAPTTPPPPPAPAITKPATPPPPAKSLPAWVITRRRERERRTYEAGKELVRRFPLCFMPHDEPKKPLAIGIAEAVYAARDDIPPHDLINAVTDYVESVSYLRCMVAGAERVGLDGTPIGVVNVGDEMYARAKLRSLVGGKTATTA